ncbi:MAG: DUF1080 domain-containing protein, partial [Verrucomicrobiota bacterium]
STAEESAWTDLFNGQDLSGWVIEKEAAFSVKDGLIVLNKGAGWLRSKDTFGDFELLIEFRFLEEKANSGIFVRTGPESHDDEKGWPNHGYQVQLMDNLSDFKPLATMLPYGAPPFAFEHDLDAVKTAYHPDGEWNQYRILCVGETLEVRLNDVLVTRAWDIKVPTGHIGIQAEFGHLEFSKLQVREVSQ